MKRKNLLTLVLVGLLSTSLVFTGCSTKNNSSDSSSKASETKEPYVVNMSFLDVGQTPKDLQLVEDEINKISVPEINTKVKLVPFSVFEYAQKFNLMLSSGDKIDIAETSSAIGGLGPFVGRGQLTQLDDLYNKYGADIKKAEGIAISGGYYNGNLYAIPSTNIMGAQYGFAARTDLVKKYNIDTNGIKTYEDMDAIFKKVHDGEGDHFYTMALTGLSNTFVLFNNFDTLGSSLASGGILNGGIDSTKIVNIFATPEYKKNLEWMRKWYKAGYFPKDAATSTATFQQQVSSNTAFGMSIGSVPGALEQTEKDTNKDLTLMQLTKPNATTSCFQYGMWSIPASCENPEAAMKFINLMYKNEKVVNLISNGIEGKHYVKTNDPMVITYPNGVDAKTDGFSNLFQIYGDRNKAYVWQPTSPKIFDEIKTFNAEVTKNGVSKALGYVFNTDPVKTEFAAVTNVIAQYQVALETGSVDVDTQLPKFLDQLKAAGIDKIITENQKQLDAWLAKKGK